MMNLAASPFFIAAFITGCLVASSVFADYVWLSALSCIITGTAVSMIALKPEEGRGMFVGRLPHASFLLPVICGSFAYGLIVTSSMLRYSAAAVAGLLVYVYLKHTSGKGVSTAAIRGSLAPLALYGTTITSFLASSSMFAVQAFLNIPVWMPLIILLAAYTAMLFSVFWCLGAGSRERAVYLAVAGLVFSEAAWSLSFLPLAFSALGLVMAIIYYIVSNLSRHALKGDLGASVVRRYAVIGLACIALILLTSRWI